MNRFLPGIRAIAFDAVGTLIFPNPGASRVYAEVAARHGFAVQPEAISTQLWAEFRQQEIVDRASHWITSEARERDRWRRIVFAALPQATEELFEELFQHFAKPTAWAVPPEAVQTMHELHSRGYILGMASNYDSRLRQVVDGHPDLMLLRERLVISSLVGVRKPGLGFFTQGVLPALRVPAPEILFVGDDHENDFDGATEAGMRAVLLDANDKHPDTATRIRNLRELIEA